MGLGKEKCSVCSDSKRKDACKEHVTKPWLDGSGREVSTGRSGEREVSGAFLLEHQVEFVRDCNRTVATFFRSLL